MMQRQLTRPNRQPNKPRWVQGWITLSMIRELRSRHSAIIRQMRAHSVFSLTAESLWLPAWEIAYAVAVHADGKIFAAGYTAERQTGTGKHASSQRKLLRNESFALACYNPDGSLDTTFGKDGLVITSFPGDLARARTVCAQPNG